MKIEEVVPQSDWSLIILTDEGRKGIFDVKPYLSFEVFELLQEINEFMKISNGKYFVEWDNGADLSADTILKKMKEIN
jgi:hypothetical protein